MATKTYQPPDIPSTTIPTTSKAPDLDHLNGVSFNGNGYLDLDKKLLDYAKGRQVIITIELSTIEPQGMLLWQGKNDKDMSNYIALGIDNKHVSFNYSKFIF